MKSVNYIDNTTAVTEEDYAAARAALDSGVVLVPSQMVVNAKRMEGLPDYMNAVPMEMYISMWGSNFKSPAEVFIEHPGAAASTTNNFNAALMATSKVPFAHEVIGIEISVNHAGVETNRQTGIQITGSGIFNDIAIDTALITEDVSKEATAILLFTGYVDGQIRLNPVKVGAHMSGQPVVTFDTDAADVAGVQVGSDLVIADNNLEVKISSSLNKTVRMTLIDGGYRAGYAHISQIIAAGRTKEV